jgi:hypothetical protein
LINALVRLANRLKALTMTQYSSDEEEESDSARPPSSGEKKATPFSGSAFAGSAFAEVVRTKMKLKQETPGTESTVESKTV